MIRTHTTPAAPSWCPRTGLAGPGASGGAWEEPVWQELSLDTPPTAFVVVLRAHHTGQPPEPGHSGHSGHADAADGYWCGPPNPDRAVGWLQRQDPITRDWTVAPGVAVYPSAWDATLAWARHVTTRRRARRPVPGYAEFLPLITIPDLGTVAQPARPARQPRGDLPPRLGVPVTNLLRQVWV
jgi:hypothetical protein